MTGGIRSDTIRGVNAAREIRRLRTRAGLSLRELAERAGTSHATIAAYEAGRKVPTFDTFVRLARGAGFDPAVELSPGFGGRDAADRGDELIEVLRLAALFPARFRDELEFPLFASAPGAVRR